MSPNVLKKCIKCDETKEFTLFRKDKDRPDGYRNVCLTCHNKKRVGYNKKYKEKFKQEHGGTHSEVKEAKRLGVSVEILLVSRATAQQVRGEQQTKKLNEEKNGLVLKQIAFENSVMVSSKECSVCGDVKSVTEFYPSKRHRDGYEGRCKQCNSVKAKRYEMSDEARKHKQEYDKQYRQEKKDKNKEQSMREPRDEDLILTRLETAVTADTLGESADKMKIYLMALMSIAYEVDDDEMSDKITTIHEAMSVEVDDLIVVSRSLEYRAQEVACDG